MLVLLSTRYDAQSTGSSAQFAIQCTASMVFIFMVYYSNQTNTVIKHTNKKYTSQAAQAVVSLSWLFILMVTVRIEKSPAVPRTLPGRKLKSIEDSAKTASIEANMT